MEMKSVPVNENTLIVIRTSSDLFLTGDDEMEVRFFGSEDRMQVHKEEHLLRIENHSGLDLIIPRSARVHIEKVGGSAFFQDVGQLNIQKIGGDLTMQRVGPVEIGKVGGSLTVRGVNGPFEVKKVGGDLLAREIVSPMTIEVVGGDIDLQVVGGEQLALRCGGDLTVYSMAGLPASVQLRSGGDSNLYVPGEVNASFEVVSEGETIDVQIGEQDSQGSQTGLHRKHYEFSLGDGEGRVEIRAGGDVRISDEAIQPSSLSAELERLETSWMNARENRARYGWPGHFDPERSAAWADMISRRAQDAARRVEQRTQSAARRFEEQVRRGAGFDIGDIGLPPFPFEAPQPPQPPAAPPVTDQERMMVLEMLQQSKISVEQAQALLRALEGRQEE